MKAVIFDLDGVLADTPHIVIQADLEVFGDIGLIYDEDDYKKNYGSLTITDLLQKTQNDLLNLNGKSLPEDTRQRLAENCLKGFQKHLKPCKGVVDALGQINLPKAVASNSDQDHMHSKLDICGITPFFHPHIYSSQRVAHPKPEPDIYIYAAHALNIQPQDCIAIEDSPSGVKAAVAANMTTIGFIGGSHCDDQDAQILKQSGADHIIDDMRDLLRFL